MQTKKGAFRLVVIGNKYVYKFPAMRFFWGVIKNIPRMLLRGDGKFIFGELAWGWKNFLRGVSENNSERRCWKRTRRPFLVPTLWGLGLLNIQKREYGPPPSAEELQYYFGKLSPTAREAIKNLDAHCLEPGNFIKTPAGIKLVDYDDGNSPAAKKYPFTLFLEKWHRELEEALMPRISHFDKKSLLSYNKPS